MVGMNGKEGIKKKFFFITEILTVVIDYIFKEILSSRRNLQRIYMGVVMIGVVYYKQYYENVYCEIFHNIYI